MNYPFKSRGRDVHLYEPLVVLQPEQIEIGDGVRIDSFVDLRGGLGLRIGHWVHIANHASINIGGGYVELGAESSVARGGSILGGSADPAWPSMSAAAIGTRQATRKATTIIGPRACVAVNAVVLPGCHLGEGAILAAGAVATHPIPPWEIWVGVPARFHSRRPQRHDTA